MKGLNNIFKQHPGEIDIVANQAAQWEANKAKNIVEIVMQQHNDLCAVFSIWTNMIKAAAESIKAAGRADDIYVITNGGGRRSMACDGLKEGIFDYVWSYDCPGQARDVMDVIKILLQTDSKPGTFKWTLYTPLREMSVEKFNPRDCWEVDDCK